MMNGGMISISWAKEHVPAILCAWYPGELGGVAIINTLLGLNNPGMDQNYIGHNYTGLNNPGGKVPTTWYDDSILQRSIYDMNLDSGDGLTHMYYTKQPLFDFGWGLSFTSFAYTWAPSTARDWRHSISTATFVAEGAVIAVDCTVKNTGNRSGDAVVLGFVNSTAAAFPRQRLFDFERVTLAPGAEVTVSLNATAEDLSVVDERGRRWLPPAQFVLRVGDVVAPVSLGIELLGPPLLLEDLSAFTGAE